jgi:CheY-like chemotaxis protein
MPKENEEVFKTILDGVRVLVVDSSPENRASFEQLLAFHGAAVIQAESPAEAAVVMDTTLPDVIVADDEGSDMVAHARDRQPKDGRPIPVIALTANGSGVENEDLTKAGCHAVLCKPFDPEKLITLVAASVGRC